MSDFSAEDREAICETFARLLTEHGDEAKLREVIETEAGFDAELWQKIAELGLTGLLISPEFDGAGATLLEVEALMEVAGKFLYSGPYLSSCVIAPTLLQACADTELVAPHLKNIASGTAIFAVAGCSASGDWTQSPNVVATQEGQTYHLNGRAHFVTHATTASHCLVVAKLGQENAVFLINMAESKLAPENLPTDDPTLRISHLEFNGTPATRLDGVGAPQIHAALRSGLIGLAGEQVGATRQIFDLTIEYLNTRFQFGQPIGRFQALKHMAADLLIDVESASSVGRHAAKAAAEQNENLDELCYLAAFTCADNFRHVSAQAIQLFGGIAYTMEHPAHLYWRRAQTGQWLFGASDRFRDLYLSQMETRL